MIAATGEERRGQHQHRVEDSRTVHVIAGCCVCAYRRRRAAEARRLSTGRTVRTLAGKRDTARGCPRHGQQVVVVRVRTLMQVCQRLLACVFVRAGIQDWITVVDCAWHQTVGGPAQDEWASVRD